MMLLLPMSGDVRCSDVMGFVSCNMGRYIIRFELQDVRSICNRTHMSVPSCVLRTHVYMWLCTLHVV